MSILMIAIGTGCGTTRTPVSDSSDLQLVVQSVDPLEKVFRETSVFEPKEAVADVARGEHASFQFAVRSEQPVQNLRAEVSPIKSASHTLSPAKVGYIGYVKVGRSTPRPSRDRLLPVSGYYPDPILELDHIDVAPGQTQPVWISVPVSVDSPPGTYTGTLTLSGSIEGKPFTTTRNLTVNVYLPVIDKTSLLVTNWYTLGSRQLRFLNNGIDVEPYSESYWEMLRLLAEKMAEYRQNVALISPVNLAQYHLNGDEYSIDFNRFDQTVETFQKAGVFDRIEGGHIGGRMGNWTSPFGVRVPVAQNDTIRFEQLSLSDPRAQNFYRQFIPALVNHLREKGWYTIYMQHIADEPIAENAASYVEIARFVKELAPDLPLMEACHSRDVEGTIDVWVPQLDFLHQDFEFYESRPAAGDEVWFYTCLAPQNEYANRFIELPLLKTRILHWINYRYQIPGYLHWGFNFWNDTPFQETTGIITESGNVLPGGDAWIVYPAHHKLLSSIRLEAMRDGIVDYELLKQFERAYPEEARELARQVVYAFDRYDIHIESFREKRLRMLKLLSQKPGV